MKRDAVQLRMVQLLFLCVAGIIAARIFGLKGVASGLFLLTFPLTGLLWLWSVRGGLKRNDWLMLATIALAVLAVVADLVRNGGSLRFSYLRKVVMFSMTLLYLQAMDRTRPDYQTAEVIQVAVDILTVLMALMYLLARDRMFMIDGVVSRYLTFGFANPNGVAMYLAPMYMLTFCTLLKPGRRWEKRFRLGVLAALAFFILKTQSRNALMVTLLFTAVAVCVIFRRLFAEKLRISFDLRVPGWLAASVALFPFVFAVLYMLLVNAQWVNTVFGFLISEGKKLDSRVKMWEPAFAVIRSHPLIGSYFEISGGTGSSQMHSTHVDTAACYGIPVMLLMSWMQRNYLFQRGKRYKSRIRFLYMVAFGCSLLMGTFEAAVYSGGLGVYVFALIFLGMSRSVGIRQVEDRLTGWEWIFRRGRELWESGKKRLWKEET